MSNYIAYHVHTDDSLLDSCTKFKDYIDKAVELGQKAICFTEHGNIYNWIEKKMYCDKKGIKYMHGCEMYLTEQLEPKVRDNYHTILIAKNEDGFKELNKLIDISTREDHKYYNPRISFDEFLNISDNIIKISACLGSPLRKVKRDNPYFDKLAKAYDFYEIQFHYSKHQREYNEMLYALSQEYNKPMIVGTDYHNINKYKGECRSILKKAKRMEYDGEDAFDLTYKTYDELMDMAVKQDSSIPLNDLRQALDNTNLLYDMTYNKVLDVSMKYPKMSDDDEKTFEERIFKMCQEKIEKGIIEPSKKYLDNIMEEIRVFKKINMCSFMLFMSELCVWCKENDIPVGFCRGSVGGSTVAYILDIIDVNPVKWNTVFSRFANEDRLEIGDIDLDFKPEHREMVYDYIISRFGTEKACYILAMTTISDKGTIDDIGRALGLIWEEDNLDKDKKLNPYSLDNVTKIKKEYEENPEQARAAYSELFYYFDGLLGTTIAQSIHPAGMVVSPVTLNDNYGTFYDKDGKRVMQINMEEIHEVSLVKYDILGLKNIGIIYDTYKLIGQKYPLSHEVDWEDEKVWDDMIKSPVGIFQFEASYAFRLLKDYKPKVINDMSIINAALRPSGESYRDRLIAKEVNTNPSKQIDDLLAPNNGYLVFQEDVIKFLTDICGMKGSDADNTRRAIGRKDEVRLAEALPDILEGYCKVSDKPRDVAEEEAKTFIKIIEDSSRYMFGYNHSTGYSMIGYLCAYLRYYYPMEFIASYLNNAGNTADIVDGTSLAKLKGVSIYPPKFRYSKGRYTPDKETSAVYKGIGSIKYLNETIGEELYSLRNNTYNNFVDLLVDITENTSCNSRQISILIKLGFFAEFGKSKYLLDIYEHFSSKYKKTHIATTKAKRLLDINEYACQLENESLTIKEIIDAQIEFVGYIDYKDDSFSEDVMLISNLKKTKFNTFATLYRLCDGVTADVKVGNAFLKNNTIVNGDVIQVVEIEHKNKMKKVDGRFVTLEEKEYVLNKFAHVKEFL